MKTLEVVVGAQFGSEAKGHVVQRLTERAQRDNRNTQVIRVAGPNAGHTGYDASGQSWALRQVPVAAVTDGPAVLGVAAGSEIDLPVLLDEYDRLRDAGLFRNKMLWVSAEATMIYDDHKFQETGGHPYPVRTEDRLAKYSDDMVQRLGSTGKGIGAARAERIMRQGNRLIDDKDAIDELGKRQIAIADSRHIPTDGMDPQGHLIIEGTQGYGLGLHAGFYPKCTSSNCRAIDFMAMAGVNPMEFRVFDIWAVARIFPIRVAGNSGPLRDETSWAELGLPEERTTVTKKIRRVGMPDWGLVRDAVRANGRRNTILAVTMLDQLYPFMRDKTIPMDLAEFGNEQRMAVTSTMVDIERETGAPIGLVTTGPNTASFINH